jgi:hypothetical protein
LRESWRTPHADGTNAPHGPILNAKGAKFLAFPTEVAYPQKWTNTQREGVPELDRSNHYEAAFEGFLQWHRLCYVAVDETRRSMLGEERVKNLDFIVHGDGGWRLLVDIKGRRFPGGKPGRLRHVWECWCERDDVDGLERWESMFGPDYRSLLVFTYLLGENVALPEETPDLWTWRGQRYLFRAVTVADYRREMRRRSPSWGTVDLPAASFRRLVRPLHDFTHSAPVIEETDFEAYG